MSAEENVDVTVTLTARVTGQYGSYDLTNEDGAVTIRKVGSPTRTPQISMEDLERAIQALKQAPARRAS